MAPARQNEQPCAPGRAGTAARSNVRRLNNFNLLRMVAACAVVWSHAYPVAFGTNAVEPMVAAFGIDLGSIAVLTFFAISGYFVSQSFCRTSLVEFGVARSLRIFPGLIVCLTLTVLVLGPLVTTSSLAEYFSDPRTSLYVPHNVRLWRLQQELPGVFETNPFPHIVNGSLWTLTYEVLCYVLLATAGSLAIFRRSGLFACFLALYAAFYVLSIPLIQHAGAGMLPLKNLHVLTLPFVIGMALYHYRDIVPFRLSILVALAGLAYLVRSTLLFRETFVLAWCYGVFWLGFLQSRPLLRYNSLGDYSYGVYIYGFPVEQTVATVFKGWMPAAIIAFSLPLVLLLAMMSWHLVEARAMSARSLVAAWLVRAGAGRLKTARRAIPD